MRLRKICAFDFDSLVSSLSRLARGAGPQRSSGFVAVDDDARRQRFRAIERKCAGRSSLRKKRNMFGEFQLSHLHPPSHWILLAHLIDGHGAASEQRPFRLTTFALE